MTREQYHRLITNSEAEITARLNAIYLRHAQFGAKDIIEELDRVIALIQQIKRAYIFLKNAKVTE